MSDAGIGRAGARGASITILGQGGKIAIQFASIVVLSRLLSPADFGLVAMLGVFTALGELIRDFGLTAASIRAKSLTNSQKSTLFWINFGIGLALFVIMTACAVPISLLYGDDRLIWLTPVIATIFIINGAQAQFMVELARNLRFTALAVTEVLGQFAGFCAAVAAAVAGLGYWALAIQMVTAFGVTLIARAVSARWLPGLPSRSSGIGSMVKFGGHVGASQMLSYAANNVDTLVVGLRWGATPLGFYNRAYQLISLPVFQLLNPLTNVVLPLLTRVREDPRRLWSILLTVQAALGYTLALALAVGAGNADAAFALLLGAQWAESVPIFQILAIGACFQVLSFVNYWVYLTFGIGRTMLQSSLITKSIGIALPVIGSSFGILGVAGGYAVALMISWPINVLWLRRAVGMPARPFVARGLRVITLGGVVYLLSIWIAQLMSAHSAWLSLAGGIGGSLAVVLLTVGIIPGFRRDFVAVRKAVALLKSKD